MFLFTTLVSWNGSLIFFQFTTIIQNSIVQKCCPSSSSILRFAALLLYFSTSDKPIVFLWNYLPNIYFVWSYYLTSFTRYVLFDKYSKEGGYCAILLLIGVKTQSILDIHTY